MEQNVIDTQETEITEQFNARILETIEGDELELPLLPHVIWEVMDLSADDAVDASRLSDLIHQDVSLAGHVLRVANSPAFMPRYPITSLQQAVSRLGMTQLSEIAFCIALRGKVFHLPRFKDEIQHLWNHALQTAFFAKTIAVRCHQNPEEAFLCGLLHDIGKPVILQIITDLQKKLAYTLVPSTLQELLETHHTQAGGRLADAWQLASPVRECIMYHHVDQDTSTCAEAVAVAVMVTRLADCMSYGIAYDVTLPGSYDKESLRANPIIHNLHFSNEDLDALFDQREVVLQFAEAMT
jgi:putative nucleotidyltransferase with HDIG domain